MEKDNWNNDVFNDLNDVINRFEMDVIKWRKVEQLLKSQ